jgi:hypothetical protein
LEERWGLLSEEQRAKSKEEGRFCSAVDEAVINEFSVLGVEF